MLIVIRVHFSVFLALVLVDRFFHSGWSSIGWNVVATFVSHKSVSQTGL